MTRIYAKFEQNILCTSYQSQSSALFMHFLKDWKNYIWEEFHNHLTDTSEKIKLIHFIFDFPIKIFKDISACGWWLNYEDFYPIVISSIYWENIQTMPNFRIDKIHVKYFVQILHMCASSLSFLKSFWCIFSKYPAASDITIYNFKFFHVVFAKGLFVLFLVFDTI